MDFAAARQIMVDSQIRPNDVTDPDIVRAFLSVPREHFVPRPKQTIAYSEMEISTGENRALWIPRDTGKLVAALDPSPGDVCLVVAAGAGYEAAILSHLCDTVIAIDETAETVDKLSERMAHLGLDRVVAVEAPLTEGLPDQGPFDLIVICGMVEQVSGALTAQLADGGRLAAVVAEDSALGRGRIYTRSGDVVSHRDVFDATPPKLEAFNAPRPFVF
ncbi:MAG: protein-L-isoaspartate O-methyltransferase [Pseudomonadota bacterium]